ncbi:MAG: tRNA lysidine(34) synthetase TilS [Eubacteriales bacterium]|jgi:tRNA(Ile)-lysidine synthase|nr:tRNA lysidine(34) synthetase TilS [Bacillota bacterium]MBV1727958.1 tRNA lysidine(34) synthetase TilS [Desulforudis sp.]MDP3050631.1 tRNA lysidine(34) synthetase TilS [Eubacteriales bacterium]MDQ7789105.1 tRNA lysidine(34) synthetase TilS [Clostridia bacterium]MBU4553505.1 tRNA lysidine(34) synthetase TilS [Bacillota bacterium]
MEFLDLVRQTVKRYRMFREGGSVLVAVSGGPDSTALLDVLFRLAPELRLSLTVAHLNHKFRGQEADDDALHVHNMAARYGLPYVGETEDVPAYRQEQGLSAQVAARDIRYRFLEETAREIGAQAVALGHNADDQAETIILNFLRGTGLAGLGGIPPVRDRYVRPLIDMRRVDIEGYCRREGLITRQDSSNLKPVYTRNRLRHQLMPLLEKEYNPALVTVLLRLGEIARSENQYLDDEAATALDLVREPVKADGSIALNLDTLRDVPPVICRRVLRQTWQLVAGPVATDYRHIERLYSLLQTPSGGQLVELPGGITAEKMHRTLRFRTAVGSTDNAPYSVKLEIPGETVVPNCPWSIRAVIWEGEIDLEDVRRSEDRSKVYVDYDCLESPLELRNRRQGDIFEPFGLGGTVKLKKYFNDLGLARDQRDDVPLVVDSRGRIIWVVGLRPADFCRITSLTRRALYLQVVGQPPEWA